MSDLFSRLPSQHRARDFRDRRTGKLDREYLRTCAIYRMLRQGRSTFDQAKIIAPKITATIEIWRAGPLRHLA